MKFRTTEQKLAYTVEESVKCTGHSRVTQEVNAELMLGCLEHVKKKTQIAPNSIVVHEACAED